MKIRTLAIHGGEADQKKNAPTIPDISMATAFKLEADTGFSIADQDAAGDQTFVYTRWDNPTVHRLAQKLALLEGAERCLLFSSGMAAISTLFFQILQPGDHLVMSDIAYAGASELVNELLGKMDIRISRVNMSDLDRVEAAVQPETKLVYIETPCNPICRLTDIRQVAEIAHRNGALLAVDATFSTPIATQPIALGADLVVHSLTKYIGGHGDAVGGALLGPAQLLAKVHTASVRMGGVISPFNAWLIMRGMATLPLRMAAHQQNALEVARFLEQHDRVERVIYPGLPSHPQYELARRQMRNFSGMLTFQVKDPERAVAKIAAAFQVFHYAVSLGHHKSLIFYLDTDALLQSSFHLTKDQERAYRAYAGPGIFRVSVGIEDPADLCEDLAGALR